jgi:hypothetical protein
MAAGCHGTGVFRKHSFFKRQKQFSQQYDKLKNLPE